MHLLCYSSFLILHAPLQVHVQRLCRWKETHLALHNDQAHYTYTRDVDGVKRKNRLPVPLPREEDFDPRRVFLALRDEAEESLGQGLEQTFSPGECQALRMAVEDAAGLPRGSLQPNLIPWVETQPLSRIQR